MTPKVKTEVDCISENCPMPLVKTREAILRAEEGDVIRVKGTHPQSFEEIPMALDAMGIEILEKTKDGELWTVTFVVS
ncbi:MAG: sulfurtransferase TusA family protein [Spirochaetes bacterium]|nr:sulfurtransferase TusA family protein [Spirochaetota bacterium]